MTKVPTRPVLRGAAPLLATLLAAADTAWQPALPALLGAAVLCLMDRPRRGWVWRFAGFTFLVSLAFRVQVLAAEHAAPTAHDAWIRQTLQGIETQKTRMVSDLEALALRAASLPETRRALRGDRAAYPSLFTALDQLTHGRREALAIHNSGSVTVAWAGAVGDPPGLPSLAQLRRDVFVVEGSVSTSLVATAPIVGGDGRALGLATAEIPLRVRRNIRNEFLADFDRFTDAFPGVEVRYADFHQSADPEEPSASRPAGTISAKLRGPQGTLLATVWVSPSNATDRRAAAAALPRRATAALAIVTCLAWMATAPRTLRVLVGLTAIRVVLLGLGPPWPSPNSPLLSADHYASPWFGPLLRSPLDLLWTTAWITALAASLALASCRRAPTASRPFLRAGASLLSLPLIGGTFACIADTVSNTPLDLEVLSLLPRSGSHIALQVALLLMLASGFVLLVALFARAGPLPARPGARVQWAAYWTLIGGLAFLFWPRGLIGLPLTPAALLVGLAAVIGGTTNRWFPWLERTPPGARAATTLVAVAVLTALLHPTLVHFGEKNVRLQIEGGYAHDVLRQPGWRTYVLDETRRRIDALALLEEDPPGPNPPGIEQLAFFVWAQTGLASFGFSSAVEIQDPRGAVVSRFALNLPSLEAAPRRLPTSVEWTVTPERIPVGSAEERVVHARRLLVYHGLRHGAVHVYVGQDFWNLPFLTGRDPYSILYRSAPRTSFRDRPIGLVVYEPDRGLVFSSAERPPALPPELLARARTSKPGLWTTIPIDGRPHHTYLFTDGQTVYGLSYPRLGAGRFAADLVEAVSAMSLAAVLILLVLVLLRTALRRPTLSLPSMYRGVVERFSLRLFVAFVGLAIVPVAALQVVVRGFVRSRLWAEASDQALDRAAVARRAVETYSSFQRSEGAGIQAAVSDDALVFVAGLVRNDLAVFDAGRLRASSKRELYASGLLPSRVSGQVYRALALDGEPSVLSTETIGGFAYRVASVPVDLGSVSPAILSLPLGLRQRDVEAVLEDLDRTIRLGSLLFLVAAAGLSHSMARRISGPIRALTQATRRVAQGDLTARVETSSQDELKALVSAFNQMAGDLDRQRRDLERSNRLAAWADVARQVAHEVKNPLTPIQLSAEHLRRVFRDSKVDFAATLETCTETILNQVRTLRGIVTEFSAFARPPAAMLERHELGAMVAEVLRPYQAALPPQVNLQTALADGSLFVLGDRRLLERALVNLIENALQAVGEAGWVEATVGRNDGKAFVTVTDSGPGIDPLVRSRLFEPFFSTKAMGSGLGLALVKKIAEDHGGGVQLESNPGDPTRMTLWLPLARDDQNSL